MLGNKEESIETLARRYHSEQGVEIERARALARDVGEHDALLEAAMRWLGTGVFPEEPEVAGITPAKLRETGAPPTTVFVLMDYLYSDPEEALDYIAHDLASHLQAAASGVTDLNDSGKDEPGKVKKG